MSGYEFVSIFVSVAGSAAVIVTLWFVYRQTQIFARQTEYVARTLSMSLSETINSQIEDMTRIFIQYPEMRPYFYKGQPIDENHANYARAEAIAELIADTLFAIASQAKRSPEARSGQHGADSWLSDVFTQSPILVKFLTERESWYGKEFVELMRHGVKARQSQT